MGGRFWQQNSYNESKGFLKVCSSTPARKAGPADKKALEAELWRACCIYTTRAFYPGVLLLRSVAPQAFLYKPRSSRQQAGWFTLVIISDEVEKESPRKINGPRKREHVDRTMQWKEWHCVEGTKMQHPQKSETSTTIRGETIITRDSPINISTVWQLK